MNPWNPRCRCGEPAMATLIYVWDTIEERRAIVCRRHYDSALDAVEKLRGSAPDAVADLRVLVTI